MCVSVFGGILCLCKRVHFCVFVCVLCVCLLLYNIVSYEYIQSVLPSTYLHTFSILEQKVLKKKCWEFEKNRYISDIILINIKFLQLAEVEKFVLACQR